MKNILKETVILLVALVISSSTMAADIIVDKTIERALSGHLTIKGCNTKPRIRIDNKVIPLSKVFLLKTATGYKYRARYKAIADSAKIAPFFPANTCTGSWTPKQKIINLKFNIINFNKIYFSFTKNIPIKPNHTGFKIERVFSGFLSTKGCNAKPKIRINNKTIQSANISLRKMATGYRYHIRYITNSNIAKIQPFFSRLKCQGIWTPKTKTINLKVKILHFNNINFKFKNSDLLTNDLNKALIYKKM